MGDLWLDFTQTTDFKSKVSTEDRVHSERHIFILLKLEITEKPSDYENFIQVQAFYNEGKELTHKNQIRASYYSSQKLSKFDRDFLFLKVPFSKLCRQNMAILIKIFKCKKNTENYAI